MLLGRNGDPHDAAVRERSGRLVEGRLQEQAVVLGDDVLRDARSFVDQVRAVV